MQSDIPKPLISHRSGNVPINSVNVYKIFQSVLIPPEPQIARQLGLFTVPFGFGIPGLDFASLFVDRGKKTTHKKTELIHYLFKSWDEKSFRESA